MKRLVCKYQHLSTRNGPNYRITIYSLSYLEKLLGRLPHLFEIVNINK
jgi:hypothetical protein